MRVRVIHAVVDSLTQTRPATELRLHPLVEEPGLLNWISLVLSSCSHHLTLFLLSDIFCAASGSGVYVQYMHLTLHRLLIIFLQREDIPRSLSASNNTIDTSSWGTPAASFTSCNISTYFGPQQLVFDITLCGQEWVTYSTWTTSHRR